MKQCFTLQRTIVSFKTLLHVSFYCGGLCVSLAATLFITFGEPKSMISPFKDCLLKHMSFYK